MTVDKLKRRINKRIYTAHQKSQTQNTLQTQDKQLVLFLSVCLLNPIVR